MGDSQYDISAIQEEHDDDFSRREEGDLEGDVGIFSFVQVYMIVLFVSCFCDSVCDSIFVIHERLLY